MDKYTVAELAYKNGYQAGIKGLAEKLKEQKIKPEFPWDDFYVTETIIDNTIREMIEK